MKNILWYMGVLSLVLISCESSRNSTEQSTALNSHAQSAVQVLLKEKDWLNTQNINAMDDGPIKLGELSGESTLRKLKDPDALVEDEVFIGNRNFVLKVSLWNQRGSWANKLDKSLSDDVYGIALDPDEFYSSETDDEIEFPVWRSDNSTDFIKLKNPDIERTPFEAHEARLHNQQVKESIEYPVFFVAAEEQTLQAQGGTIAAGPQYNPWLEIHEINYYITHESGDPEFQLFEGFIGSTIGDPSFWSVIGANGSIEFDGTNQYNPPNTNRNIYIRNVDKTDEVFDQPVLVTKLINQTDGSQIVGFIESDEGGIQHYSTSGTSVGGGYLEKTATQYYSVVRSGADGFRTETYSCIQSNDKSDDIIIGEAIGVSLDNVNTRLTATGKDHFWLPVKIAANGYLFSDLDVKFKKGMWPY